MVDILQGIISGFFAGIGFFGAEWLHKKYIEKRLNNVEQKVINIKRNVKSNKGIIAEFKDYIGETLK